MALTWLRLYHGTASDPKWIVVGRKVGVPPGMVYATWCAVLEYASENTPRGSAKGFDIEAFAAFAGWEETDIAKVMDAFRSKRLINPGGSLAAWPKRNPKREDASAERVRMHRQRKAAQANGPRVTQGNAAKRAVTPDEMRVDERREQITETEKDTPPVVPPLQQAVGDFCRDIGCPWKLKASIEEWCDKLPGDYEHLPAEQLPVEVHRCNEWHQTQGVAPKAPDRAIRNWLGRAKPAPASQVPDEDAFAEQMERDFAAIAEQEAAERRAANG
jgi:hypothetical protein